MEHFSCTGDVKVRHSHRGGAAGGGGGDGGFTTLEKL